MPHVHNWPWTPLHVATLAVQAELPKYEGSLPYFWICDSTSCDISSLPYLCTKNEAMAPLRVATLTVIIELPKYETIFSIQGLYLTSVPRMKPWLHFMWPHLQLKESYLKLFTLLLTKNETVAPFHVATLTVESNSWKRATIIFSI